MVTQIARKILLQYHPRADTWVCPQDWEQKDFARWNQLIAAPGTADWLTGVIYGPVSCHIAGIWVAFFSRR